MNNLPNKITYVLGYARISSIHQIHGTSIESQTFDIENYAKNNGCIVKKIYAEQKSAKNIKERPELNKLLADIQPNDRVVVYSLSRLTRNSDDASWLKREIQIKKKAKLVILDSLLLDDSPEGEVMYTIQSAMTQFERRKIGQRVSFNMQYLSCNNLLKPRLMYGYQFVSKGVPYVKNTEEQKIIEYIRDLRYNNPEYSINKICQILDSEGIKLRKCKKAYPSRVIAIMEQNGIEKYPLLVPNEDIQQ